MKANLNINKIKAICEKHKVKKLFVFGSAVRDDFDEKSSDLDFIVEFNKEIELLDFGNNFFSLQFALEDLSGKKVDLVCREELKNPFFKEVVNNTQRELYAE